MPPVEQSAGKDGGAGMGDYEKSLLSVGKINTVGPTRSIRCNEHILTTTGGSICEAYEQPPPAVDSQAELKLPSLQG